MTSARPLVYKAGRVYILLALAALPLAAGSARAQDAATPPPAPPADAPAPVAAPAAVTPELLQRIDEIDQRSRIVDRKIELAEEAAAAKKKEAVSATADDGGFALTGPEKAFQIKLRGLIQLDARRFFGDRTLEDRDTFVVRRIRPIFAGTVGGLADFLISPDFGNNATVVTDAYIDIHPWPFLRLRGGKFKPPIGLERLQSDQDLSLIERALDSNLSAQREIGLQLWGDIAGGLVRYELGVYNGVPDATLLDTDSNHAKTFAGRVFVQPFASPALKDLGRLGVGIAASTGNEKGSSALTGGAASNTWLSGFRSAGQNTIYSYVSSTTDLTTTVFALERHTRVNPQLYYYLGSFGLLAEWLKEYQEVGKGSATGAVNHQGGHLTVSYVIGGDAAYEGAKVKKAINLAEGSIGAVEIAARYNWLDLDDVGFPTLANPSASVTRAQGFAFGLNWLLTRNLKAMGAYERTSFTGGAARSGNRNTEKVALGRLQIAF